MTKNKIWKLVISCVIAIGLWIYVVTVVSPGSVKTYYDVPVNKRNFTGLSEKFVITEYDKHIDVRLEGNRIDLNALDASSIVVEADLSAIQKPGTYHISYTSVPTGNFASNAFVVQKSEPEKLTIKVENVMTKKVPVVLPQYESVAPTHWMPLDRDNDRDKMFDYTEVEVRGPESLVSKIEYAVVAVEMEGRSESAVGEFDYELCDKNMKRVDADPALIEALTTDKIQVNIPIYVTKELPLNVTVNPGGGAKIENCLWEVGPVKMIKVAGPADVMEPMTSLTIDTIELKDLMEDEIRSISITELLEKQKLVNLTEVNDFTVTVKLTGLDTKTITVDRIDISNPEYQINVANPAVSIKIRGPQALIEKLTEKDVRVILEVTGTDGTLTVKPKVEFAEDFQDLDVLETSPQSFILIKKS